MAFFKTCRIQNGILLPSKPSLEIPSSSLTSRSCAAVKTGPSLHTRYLPITQLPHKPMPQRISRSKLASIGMPLFSVMLKTWRIMGSGPQA